MRKIISTAANILVRLVLLPGVKDTQCGFKVFEERAAKAIFGRMTLLLWSFDIEILAIANQSKYQIEYFQADDWHDPKEAGEGLVGDSAVKVALKSFFDPFKIRWNIWTNRYRNVNYEHRFARSDEKTAS